MSEVHAGKDGWLFLIGGSNDVLSFYTDPSQFHPGLASTWCEEIRRRSEIAQDIGAKYLHFVAPEKLKIYRHKTNLELPQKLVNPSALVGDMLAKHGASSFYLDLTDILIEAALDNELYLKTDTHWNHDGILVVYRAICDRLGIPQLETIDGRECVSYRGIFDLGGKLSPPIDEENIHLPFPPGVRRVFANKVAEMWDEAAARQLPVLIHNSLHVVYRNDRPNALKQTVVIFGDSFIDFRPTTLSSCFIEQFEEVHCVWSTSIDEEYIRKINPDLFITENAERFMRTPPYRDYRIEQDMENRLRALESRT